MTYALPNARGHLSSSCVMAAIAATPRVASCSAFATALIFSAAAGGCWGFARRRRHERALDRPPRAARLLGAGHVHGPPDRASRWYRPRRGRRVAIFNGHVLTARAAAGRA